MSEVVISRADLANLGEYSCSLPSLTTIGKRWRRDVHAFRSWHPKGFLPLPCLPQPPIVVEEWQIGEYIEHPEPGKVGIKWAWAMDENGRVHRGDLGAGP